VTTVYRIHGFEQRAASYAGDHGTNMGASQNIQSCVMHPPPANQGCTGAARRVD
jgi:hypothetical protein